MFAIKARKVVTLVSITLLAVSLSLVSVAPPFYRGPLAPKDTTQPAQPTGHHTVIVICTVPAPPPGVTASPCDITLTLKTLDGAIYNPHLFEPGYPASTSTSFIFTGLTGGSMAIDTTTPNIGCSQPSTMESVTYVMNAGATMSGPTGIFNPTSFTVPLGNSATVTISC